MKKSFLAPILSLIIIVFTVLMYIILKRYVNIPKTLAVIIFVGLVCLSGYFIYFSSHDIEEKNDKYDIVKKAYNEYF